MNGGNAMGINMDAFKGRDFLKLLDFTSEEIKALLDFSAELKEKKKNRIPHRLCDGKSVALIFEKSSTRTRCAFEVACCDLGIHPVHLDPRSSQMGKKESIPDTARVLSRMFDGIEYRGYGQDIVEEIAEYADVPVWNGLTDDAHPTQILADFLTAREKFGTLEGKKLIFIGDSGFNMGHSLMIGCAKMGMHFVACSPEKYLPRKTLVDKAREIANETGGSVTLETDPSKAAKDADIIYTDVWVSMGEPDEVWKERIDDLMPYQVNAKLMSYASPDCIFMHCLPAFHDLRTGIGRENYQKFGVTEMEVTDEVFESKASVVFDEAENRMHTIKAVIAATIGEW